jgi:glycosyltransferase involved in cell wall biosynthesis
LKKILHINDYPVGQGGGAEIVMARTIELLRTRGLTVDAFTAADLADPRLTPWRYLNNAEARWALTARLDAFEPDVVHLHNYYHILSPGILAELDAYKRRRPLRVVMTAHDYHLVCPNAGGSWFRWLGGRREIVETARLGSLGYQLTRAWDHRSGMHSLLKLLQHAWHYRWRRRQRVIDHVICPSRFVQQALAAAGLATTWLPHPAPVGLPTNVRRPATLHLVFAGRIEPEKGLHELLGAVPSDFAAQLIVVGAGEDRARCERICAERHLQMEVQFLGRQPHTETLAQIAGAHVLVQPSRVLETYGLTLIEALAASTNVLASDRGASREIVEDAGVGFLYDVEKPASLVEQLHEIRHRHEAGTLNRFRLDSFLQERSEARYIDALLRIYDGNVLARHALAA